MQELCKKWIRTFWNNLAKEEELGSLPGTIVHFIMSYIKDIVAMIEKYEKKSEHIYKKLMIRFPKSVRVLRAYAIFLEEVQHLFFTLIL